MRDEVDSKDQIEKSRKQKVDVPAAIEHAWSIRQDPIVDVFHVLTGEEKYNYDRDSDYQMKPFHRVVGLAL